MWQIAIDEPLPFELLAPRSLQEALELASSRIPRRKAAPLPMLQGCKRIRML
jgi:hypothetical protein